MNGLILVGGQSKRMGEEKRLIEYNGASQEHYLYHLLKINCESVFISCNAIQAQSIHFTKIIDESSQGPLSGIEAAFLLDATQPWLVVACDMPAITLNDIQFLIKNRNSKKVATAFINPTTLLPEPLFAIYEPSFKILLDEAQKKGVRSPMNILLNNDFEKIITQSNFLLNINTIAEKDNFIL